MKKYSSPHMNTGSGFTLIELVVAMSVAVILFTVAAPGFTGIIRDMQMSSATNDFFAAINLARAEAVQRGARVDMVPEDEDWASGWVVFVDGNGNRRPDTGDVIIFRHGPAPKGMQITAKLTDSTVQYLAYNGSGRTRTHANAYRTQFGTITFELGDKVRKIKLNFIGRARICNPETDPHTC